MHRYTIAAFAALAGIFVCPSLQAARPTHPVRPARYGSAEPHLRASHSHAERRSTLASTHHRQLAAAPHAASAAHPSSRTRRSRRASQDDASFVSRSARAAAERRAQHAPAPRPAPIDAAEVRSRLRELDATSSIPQLLPPPRTLALYDDRGRLIVPAPLRGSREVLLHQNEMADDEGLTRVRDDAELDALRDSRQLVPLPADDALHVDERLPEDRRYSRPWTALFLSAMARDFYATFHAPLQVDSAVRTVAVQKHLDRTNGNAAPAEGETASPHLTGQAVDIAKRGLTIAEIAWLRLYLQPLIDADKIDVEEEFRQACFHISVYKNYLAPGVTRTSVADADAVAKPNAEP